MSKTLFIYENELDKVITNEPLGVIFRIKDEPSLERIQNLFKKDKHNIKKIIIETAYIEGFKIAKIENLYYKFINEDLVREQIYKLPDEDKQHILGNKVCRYGLNLLQYQAIGIKNVFISSPLLNNKINLSDLVANGWNFWTVANYQDTYHGVPDASWIRPEGLSIYKDIIENYVLVCSKKQNINIILSAYIAEQGIARLRDYIVNFDHESNPYRNCQNLLTLNFDAKRASCRAECHRCSGCERYLKSIKKLFEK